MTDKVSSNKIVFYNLLSTVLIYTISFFSAPIFSRILGSNNYGLVQIYNTWLTVFTVLVGIESRGTLMIAKAHMDNREYKEYCSSIMGLTICFFAVAFLGVICFRSIVSNILGLDFKYIVLLIFHCFANHCVLFINAKFTYEMEAKNNMILAVILASFSFGLSFVLIKVLPTKDIYAGRLLGDAVPYIIASLFVVILVFNQGKSFYNSKHWRYCLSLAIPLVIHGIGAIICESSDRIMIQKMMTLSEVGIYSLAYSFAKIVDSIKGAFNNSWNPFFIDLLRENKIHDISKRAKDYIRVFSSIVIGFVLLAPEVFHMLVSEEYWGGTSIIPIIVMYIYTQYIYLLGVNYELYMKRTDIIAIGTFVAGGCNVILNYIFINFLGYVGAAIATLLTGIISATIHVYFGRRLASDKWAYSYRLFVMPTGCLLLSVALYYIFYDLWIIRWSIAAIDGAYLLYSFKKTRTIF